MNELDLILGPRQDDLDAETLRINQNAIGVSDTRLGLKITLSHVLFEYYEWSQAKGYVGDMGSWILDVVETLFQNYGYRLAMVHVKRKNEAVQQPYFPVEAYFDQGTLEENK